ncbi:MAG: glycosyltransferase family 2 protein [Clostridiales bacterium]|nr:glycosyltransferase family 2 protein [Clostridiales bacterium]
MADLTAIILTLNEEKNIRECIASIQSIAKRIVVVDSFSTDKTVEIAKEMGAEVIAHEFVNQAQQFIYAIDTLDIDTKWILRIDADERFTEKSAAELEALTVEHAEDDVNGIVVRFEVSFMGKPLRHGGIYPIKVLRIFKKGYAHMEARNMDEHIVINEGRSIDMKNDCLHQDFKSLYAWVERHNKYSNREVIDYFNREQSQEGTALHGSAKFKRFVKFKIYYKLPMGFRAKLYYWYRYYLKLGFLDGKEGKIFAFLQAYWYRFLVDAKIYEKKKEMKALETATEEQKEEK